MSEINREELAQAMNDAMRSVLDRYPVESVSIADILAALTHVLARFLAVVFVDNALPAAERHAWITDLHTTLDTAIDAYLQYFQGPGLTEDTYPWLMQ
jgi:hypothetical protein